MFYFRTLLLNLYGILVNVHCTNSEVTFYNCCAIVSVLFLHRLGYFRMWLNRSGNEIRPRSVLF